MNKNNFGKKHMSIVNSLGKQMSKIAISAMAATCAFSFAINTASAGPREQAKYIHDRIAGVAPTNAVLDSMTNDINGVGGRTVDDAINTAMNNKNFLNVTVKNMVIPWTNKDQTVFFPLNDAAATIIGYVRDGTDFRRILFANDIYIGNDGSLPTYSNSNNNHYAQMEHRNLDLRTTLVRQDQDTTIGQPLAAVAGVMTTRASARAFFYAGTNRAMFRATILNYLCNDLEQYKDITRNPNHIRQDVSRSPGGDSSIFLNNCVGCHAGMDGMAGAFAYHQWGPAVYDPNDTNPDDESMTYVTTPFTYDIDGRPITTPSRVTPKHVQNPSNFIYGHITSDDSWINYWRTGVNAKFGWASNNPQAPVTGNGAASLGQELANTTEFARCQVTKVYRHVCHMDPTETTLQTITTAFTGSTYNMQTVYRESVKDCMALNSNL